MAKKNENVIYSTGIVVKTRVNGFENGFYTWVFTTYPVTNKKIRKKVLEYLMNEYSVEGMYGMHVTNNVWKRSEKEIRTIYPNFNFTIIA